MATYDPDVIRQYAEHLYIEGERAPVLYGFAGAIIAVTAGLGLGLGLESWAAGATMGGILGLLAGWVGYASGRSVASRMRLNAQTALCQVAIEKSLAALVKERDSRAAS